jgi:DNA-binding transcriptional regulator GbsR (MarR family)
MITTELTDFIERFGLMWERAGSNRTVGRLFGWLLVCDPAEQTAADLALALGVSKASVSTATRSLELGGLLERTAAPGERRTLYRVTAGGLGGLPRQTIRQFAELTELAQIAERALAEEPAHRRERVDALESFATWWQARYEELLDEWERQG